MDYTQLSKVVADSQALLGEYAYALTVGTAHIVDGEVEYRNSPLLGYNELFEDDIINGDQEITILVVLPPNAHKIDLKLLRDKIQSMNQANETLYVVHFGPPVAPETYNTVESVHWVNCDFTTYNNKSGWNQTFYNCTADTIQGEFNKLTLFDSRVNTISSKGLKFIEVDKASQANTIETCNALQALKIEGLVYRVDEQPNLQRLYLDSDSLRYFPRTPTLEMLYSTDPMLNALMSQQGKNLEFNHPVPLYMRPHKKEVSPEAEAYLALEASYPVIFG